MKLKNIFKFASAALAVGTLTGVTSCNYLDVVPPEQPGLSDAMKNHANAQGFLYSCYNGVSQRDFSPRDYRSGLNASNDEFLIPETWMAVDGPTSYAIMRNTLQTTATSYDPRFWDSYYSGIGQTLLFERELLSEGRKNNVCLDPAEEELWLAESRFCRAFYHYQLLRIYGPVPITNKFIAMDTDPNNYPGRVHVDGVVDWIANELEECARVFERYETQNGNHKRDSEYQGRATSTICYALQGRLYLLAASDLWNGKFPYKTWRNKTTSKNPVTGENYGNRLFSENYDETKWTRAMAACLRAFNKAHLNNYRLYTIEDAEHMDAEDVLANEIYIPDEANLTAPAGMPEWNKETFKETVRMLRYLNTTTPHEGNLEIIWSNQQVPYGMHDSRLPRRVLETTEANSKWKEGWNGVSPTLYTVEHFLTNNGVVPGLEGSAMPVSTWYAPAGLQEKDRERVMNICLNREPRFYAWIAFDGGDYLTLLNDNEPKLLNMQDPEQQGRGQGERNYSVTGFLSMKHVDPLSKWAASNGQWTSGKNSPDVLIRLAEVYLNLAECFAEMHQRGIAVPAEYNLFPNITYSTADSEVDNADLGKVNVSELMNEYELGSTSKDAAMALVNKIRERAYVAPLTESMLGVTDEARNAQRAKVWTLVEWVRNERFVELWDEGVRYFDVRRWVAGDEYFAYGMREGLNGLKVKPSPEEWRTPMMINSQYTFHKRQYLWPLYQSEVYNNPQMVQAPGY